MTLYPEIKDKINASIQYIAYDTRLRIASLLASKLRTLDDILHHVESNVYEYRHSS